MSNVCEHGQLARVCPICELQAECERERYARVQCSVDSQMHLMRALRAEAECERLRENDERYRCAREHLPPGVFGDMEVNSPESWDAAIDALRKVKP